MDNRKPNKPPNKNKQKKKISNPDPMSNVRDMGRYGIRVIREIAKGKFNFYNEGHIFRNLDFVRATMEEVYKRIYEADVHAMALDYAYPSTSDQIIKDLIIRDKKTSEGYNLVYSTLSKILLSEGDTRYLMILINQLPRYKYNI